MIMKGKRAATNWTWHNLLIVWGRNRRVTFEIMRSRDVLSITFSASLAGNRAARWRIKQKSLGACEEVMESEDSEEGGQPSENLGRRNGQH
jgi:uncharacterized membrane protein